METNLHVHYVKILSVYMAYAASFNFEVRVYLLSRFVYEEGRYRITVCSGNGVALRTNNFKCPTARRTCMHLCTQLKQCSATNSKIKLCVASPTVLESTFTIKVL